MNQDDQIQVILLAKILYWIRLWWILSITSVFGVFMALAVTPELERLWLIVWVVANLVGGAINHFLYRNAISGRVRRELHPDSGTQERAERAIEIAEEIKSGRAARKREVESLASKRCPQCQNPIIMTVEMGDKAWLCEACGSRGSFSG